MDFFRNNKRYFITFAIGLAWTLIMYFGRDIAPLPGRNMVFYALADATFIPGVFIFSFGILMLISNEGLFNGVTYGMKALWKALSDRKNPKMSESYYDYHLRKTGNKVRFGFMLIIGGLFIVASIVFSMMVY